MAKSTMLGRPRMREAMCEKRVRRMRRSSKGVSGVDVASPPVSSGRLLLNVKLGDSLLEISISSYICRTEGARVGLVALL